MPKKKAIPVEKLARTKDERLADKLTKIAQQQYEVGVRFQTNRRKQIQDSLDMYNNLVKPALRGRFNVPLPAMSGFVDTLYSQIDDKPSLRFVHQEEADLKKAKKVTSAWQIHSQQEESDWQEEDLAGKKQATFTGYAVNKTWCESDPKFKHNFEALDYLDFVFEPRGGQNLEKHRFLGQAGIERTDYDLKNGSYNLDQVSKLLNATADTYTGKNREEYEQKVARFRQMGLDISSNDFMGQRIIRLVEWGMEYQGERYYLVFESITGIWVRFSKLKDIFESNLWPWVGWWTHKDKFNCLSKAPADDIKPIAESMRVVFNQGLDNLQKRNWDMKAVDPDIFPDLSELEWRPDGLVQADSKGGTRSIQNGVYQFQTPDNVAITVNLMQFLDGYLGQKAGITPDAEGRSSEKRVGIYFGNLQQVAKRLGPLNQSYTKAHKRLGERYLCGLWEHMPEKLLVKMIGTQGIGWEELVKSDAEPDFDIIVSSAKADEEADLLKKQQKAAAVTAVTSNPTLLNTVNPQWSAEQILRNGGFEDEDIVQAFDKDTYGDRELLSEAAEAIQELLAGKKVPLNRGANVAFMQKILNYANDGDLGMDEYKRLVAYAMAHEKIVIENMIRKVMIQKLQGGGTISPAGAPVAPTAAPAAPVVPEQPSNPLNPMGQ